MRVTVVIPFHRNLGQLQQSLPAARHSMPSAEIIVAADGALDDCRPLAATCGARVVEISGPAGPAVARNRAVAGASGDIVVFVDADVVVMPDAIPGMCRLLDTSPDIAAVFGAYDLAPAEPNFMSQFKNLSHSYVHEKGNPEAVTFWAGLGAVRTAVFRAVGGFDERFGRPSVEDIELGYRIVAAGHRIRLDPRFRGTHLKHWTFLNCVATDLRARGIPWTQLIHRRGDARNDLNTSVALRFSVLTAYLAVFSAVVAGVVPLALVATVFLLLVLVALNLDYYRWFVRHRGPTFALRVLPVHLVHHLSNGVSFIVGTVLHIAGRWGLRLPGALPLSVWNGKSGMNLSAGARS